MVFQGRNGRRLRAASLTIAVFAAVAAWWTLTAAAALHPASAVAGKAVLAVRSGGLTGAANLAAGDSLQRQVGLTNSGTKAVAAAAIRVAGTGAALDAGLTVHVDRCSVAWAAKKNALACHGATTSLTGWFAPGSGQVSLALAGLKPRATAWLRVTVRLAAGAPAARQGVATTLTYTYSAS